jgi:hypothetical protein
MNLSLAHRPSATASASPYRLLNGQAQEVVCANAFLDAQRVRHLSPRSLRAYAYALLHFARGLQEAPQSLSEITESTLLDDVRHQLDLKPRPSPPTVDHRLGAVHCLHRFHYGQEIPPGQSDFQRTDTKRSPLELWPATARWPSTSAHGSLGVSSCPCWRTTSPRSGTAFALLFLFSHSASAAALANSRFHHKPAHQTANWRLPITRPPSRKSSTCWPRLMLPLQMLKYSCLRSSIQQSNMRHRILGRTPIPRTV